MDALNLFHPVVRDWFSSYIGTPSAPQEEGWPEIAAGRHTLICAPTGAGKTLAAFLESINQLLVLGLEGQLPDGVFILYISPLKALNNDIHRNLDMPLEGIRKRCAALNLPFPDIRKAVRTGDTPQSERQRMLKKPPHILITTPESLYLMLTSVHAAQILKNVRYVIVDEIHTMLATKRGIHLALSIARLEALCTVSPIRIGLSATVNPPELAARYLGGKREVSIVMPEVPRERDLLIHTPVPDFRSLDEGTIWPEIYDTILKLIRQHTTTIVFVNNRAIAEKVAGNVNDIAGEEICKPHHGSISREVRHKVEEEFKHGSLRCMVATATLELGIDIGSVDLMIQISAPPSISSGLQRLGRAGHRIQALSKGRIIPKTRVDLLKSAFMAREMLLGHIEQSNMPENSLDVLSQQIVSMSCSQKWTETDMLRVIRDAWGYRTLNEEDFHKVLEMLAGDYEHAEDIPSKPRIAWDRINKTVSGTAYSRMLAVGAGGTIPDRGYFPVFMEDGQTKVGELDEVFVFESRLGDVFMLGNTPWKMRKIDQNKVVVSPAETTFGARVPFWQGDGIGNAFEQGTRFGLFLNELEEALTAPNVLDCLQEIAPIDCEGAENIRQLLEDQIESNGCLSHDKRVVIEYLSDGADGQSVIIHAHFGGRVNSALAILLQGVLEEKLRVQCFSMHNDELIHLHLYGCPDDLSGILKMLSADKVAETLLRMLPSTSRFAIAFRYNAYRSLMMGSKGKSQRLPLWIQRLRSVDALENAQRHLDHPLILETMRECMQDAFDVHNTERVVRDLLEGRITVVEKQSFFPSPFASDLVFKFQSVMMYQELAAHPGTPGKTAVSGLDALHLSSGVGQLPEPSAEAVATVLSQDQADIQLSKVTNAGELHAWLMVCGDAVIDLLPQQVLVWLSELESDGRVCHLQHVPTELIIAREESSLYQAAFGLDLETDGTWTHTDSTGRILRRYARFHSPFTAQDIARRYPIALQQAEQALINLKQEGYLVKVTLPNVDAPVWCHAALYDRMRKRTMREAFLAVAAKPAQAYAGFLPKWQHIGSETAIPAEKLVEVVRQLEGMYLPAGQWESIVFPARIGKFTSALLDKVCSTGRIVWRMKPQDGKTPLLAWFLPETVAQWKEDEYGDRGFEDLQFDPQKDKGLEIIARTLQQRGASFTHTLTGLTGVPATAILNDLERLVMRGWVVNDTFQPIRFFLEKMESKQPDAMLKRIAGMISRMELGRWEWVRAVDENDTGSLVDRWLKRFGLATKEVAQIEDASWQDAYDMLKKKEYTGSVARGWFFSGLSGIQFMLPEALAQTDHETDLCVLNACDPALAYGTIVPHTHSEIPFTRVSSTAVVLKNGCVVLVAERYFDRIATNLRGKELIDVIGMITTAYLEKRLFTDKKRLTFRVWPEDQALRNELDTALSAAGFKPEMDKRVLWR